MMREFNLRSHWVNPVDHSMPMVLEADELKDKKGFTLGHLVRTAQRIEWLGGVPLELAERVAIERKKYDEWAKSKRDKMAQTWEPLDSANRAKDWWKAPPL